MSPRSLNFSLRSLVVRIISRAVSWRFLLVSVKSYVDQGLPTWPLWQNTQSTFSAALNVFISLMTSSGAIVFGRISTLTSFSGFQSSMAGLEGCWARALDAPAAASRKTMTTLVRRIICRAPSPESGGGYYKVREVRKVRRVRKVRGTKMSRGILGAHFRFRRTDHRQRDSALPHLAGDLRPARRRVDAGHVAARARNAARVRPLR